MVALRDLHNLTADTPWKDRRGTPTMAALGGLKKRGPTISYWTEGSTGNLLVYINLMGTALASRYVRVLPMDRTYSGSRYDLPLFHLVFRTPINMRVTLARWLPS